MRPRMLSPIEALFVRLLRGTVVATAFFSMLVTICALVYAAYAYYSPEPAYHLSQNVAKFRAATDPAELIKKLFPPDSDIVKTARDRSGAVAYTFRAASVADLFAGFNKFLDAFVGGKFESDKQFSDWLIGSDSIDMKWSRTMDHPNATNEDSVNRLWPSLLFDYALRLQQIAPALADVRKAHKYPTPLDRFTAPTGTNQAPYFLAWFFQAMQVTLNEEQQRFEDEKFEREQLRQRVPVSLYVAASAFGYFIFIMFLFLIVSIEASLRNAAEYAASVRTPGAPMSAASEANGSSG